MFWESFLVLLRFLVKNAKNNIFEDKCFLSKMFYQKKQAATNWSSHLKNIKHFNIFKRQIFYAIFKNRIFPRFFKITTSTRKNHCMRLILCQHGRQKPTKLDWSILQWKKCLTASHFRFQSKNLRINFKAFINDFLYFFSRMVTSVNPVICFK